MTEILEAMASNASRWMNSSKKQIGQLCVGAQFLSITGEAWTLVRQNQCKGFVVARRTSDNSVDLFAANALVVVV